MKSQKIPLFFFFCIVILLFLRGVVSSSNSPFPQESRSNLSSRTERIPLEVSYSFPSKYLEKKDVYLYGANSISWKNGFLYISNSRANDILKFDLNGNLLKKIGRFGQGPEEFNYPKRVINHNGELIVYDSFNRRLQYFDDEGKYIRGIKLFKTYTDIAIDDSGKIIATPMSKLYQTKLIDILNSEGMLLKEFGEPLEAAKRNITMNQIKIALNKSEIYAAFVHFPIVRKYNLEGDLIAEFKISNASMEERAKYNLKQSKKQEKGEKVGVSHVIESIRVANDCIYLMRCDPTLEIFQIDFFGKVKKIYYTGNTVKDYYALDFEVISKEKELLFFVLQIGPDNIVNVFKTKKDV